MIWSSLNDNDYKNEKEVFQSRQRVLGPFVRLGNNTFNETQYK